MHGGVAGVEGRPSPYADLVAYGSRCRPQVGSGQNGAIRVSASDKALALHVVRGCPTSEWRVNHSKCC
jgi:hypothetical protein